jgi:hypothetical protein
MSKEEKHPVKTKVVAGVVSGLILASIFYAGPKLFQWIITILSWVWQHATSSISIPNWLLWLLVILGMPTLLKVLKPLLKHKENSEPTFRMYTQDSFEGATWRWSYDYSGGPVNIVPFCPICDSQLVHVKENQYSLRPSLSVSFYCERCKQERARIEGGNEFYAVSMIERFIDRNVRNGEWEHVIRRTGLIEGAK